MKWALQRWAVASTDISMLEPEEAEPEIEPAAKTIELRRTWLVVRVRHRSGPRTRETPRRDLDRGGWGPFQTSAPSRAFTSAAPPTRLGIGRSRLLIRDAFSLMVRPCHPRSAPEGPDGSLNGPGRRRNRVVVRGGQVGATTLVRWEAACEPGELDFAATECPSACATGPAAAPAAPGSPTSPVRCAAASTPATAKCDPCATSSARFSEEDARTGAVGTTAR